MRFGKDIAILSVDDITDTDKTIAKNNYITFW